MICVLYLFAALIIIFFFVIFVFIIPNRDTARGVLPSLLSPRELLLPRREFSAPCIGNAIRSRNQREKGISVAMGPGRVIHVKGMGMVVEEIEYV